MGIVQVLKLISIFLGFVILFLLCMYWYVNNKNKKETEDNKKTNENSKVAKNSLNQYTKLSVFDFMQFDKIEDNMIIQDDGQRYLMVIECEGINYDLMSEVEKTSVEAGFVQFLNTLRHPIQLYTQTRTINIVNSIENYKKQLDEIKKDLDKKQNEYKKAIQSGFLTKKELEELKREVLRCQNLYEYGRDIISNIEKISSNKNVLRRHYYIIIPYYTSELGNHELSEEEKKSMIFSELYTRAESLIRALSGCNVKSRVMNSTELVELLYISYNRDEAEVYTLDKALRAGYDELYSTAPDVLDKKMLAINEEIQKKALEMAQNKVDEAISEKEQRIKQKEQNLDELIKEMAIDMLNKNKRFVGEDIAENAINKITNEEGGNVNEKKTKTRARTKTRKSTI